jgi:hypothetical protein
MSRDDERDEEIAAVTDQINHLLVDLNQTVTALNAILQAPRRSS